MSKTRRSKKHQFACDEYGRYSASKEKCRKCGIVSYCREAGDPAWIGKFPVKDVHTVESPCFDEVSEKDEKIFSINDFSFMLRFILKIKKICPSSIQYLHIRLANRGMCNAEVARLLKINPSVACRTARRLSGYFPQLKRIFNPRTKT